MCNSGMSGKKKIAIFAASSVAAISATYFAFTTHNPALAIAAPVLLTIVPCLIMCGIIGGSMWLVSRSSKNKNQSSSWRGGSYYSTKQKEDTEKVSKK